MAIELINQANFKTAANASSITINKPTNTTNGDIMFAFMSLSDSEAAVINSVPTGWSLISFKNIAYRFYLYYKVAGASEPANYSWGLSVANVGGIKIGIITTYRGQATVTPFEDYSDDSYTTSNNTIRATTVTSSVANSAILWFGGYQRGGELFSISGPTNPGTFTDVVTVLQNQSTTYLMLSSRYYIWSSTGSTGNIDGSSVDSSATTIKQGFAVVLNPVVASGPANLKSLNTNLKANIKSYNTNLIANVKSINTNS